MKSRAASGAVVGFNARGKAGVARFACALLLVVPGGAAVSHAGISTVRTTTNGTITIGPNVSGAPSIGPNSRVRGEADAGVRQFGTGGYLARDTGTDQTPKRTGEIGDTGEQHVRLDHLPGNYYDVTARAVWQVTEATSRRLRLLTRIPDPARPARRIGTSATVRYVTDSPFRRLLDTGFATVAISDPLIYDGAAGRSFGLSYGLDEEFLMQVDRDPTQILPGRLAAAVETEVGSNIPGLGRLFRWDMALDSNDPDRLLFNFTSNPGAGAGR